MDLGDSIDAITKIVMASTILVGFWEVGSQMGSVSGMLQTALDNPQTSGLGTVLFLLGIDVWSPIVNPSFLGPFSFISFFYGFSEGYVPHYSIEACLLSLTVSFIVTWIILHLTDWSFWGWGLPVAVATFFLSWYIFTFLVWNAMFIGADMMGLPREQAYQIWKVQAEVSQSPALQTLFVANIPLSFQYLARKFF